MTTKSKRVLIVLAVIAILLILPFFGGLLLEALVFPSNVLWANIIIAFFGFLLIGATFTGVHTWIRSISIFLRGIY